MAQYDSMKKNIYFALNRITKKTNNLFGQNAPEIIFSFDIFDDNCFGLVSVRQDPERIINIRLNSSKLEIYGKRYINEVFFRECTNGIIELMYPNESIRYRSSEWYKIARSIGYKTQIEPQEIRFENKKPQNRFVYECGCKTHLRGIIYYFKREKRQEDTSPYKCSKCGQVPNYIREINSFKELEKLKLKKEITYK